MGGAASRRKRADDSVFFHTWKDVLPTQDGEKELVARWKRMREIRAEVHEELEDARAAGEIGSSLQAEVEVGVARRRPRAAALAGRRPASSC